MCASSLWKHHMGLWKPTIVETQTSCITIVDIVVVGCTLSSYARMAAAPNSDHRFVQLQFHCISLKMTFKKINNWDVMLSLKSRKCYTSGSKNLFSLNISGNFFYKLNLFASYLLPIEWLITRRLGSFKGVLQISLKIEDYWLHNKLFVRESPLLWSNT